MTLVSRRAFLKAAGATAATLTAACDRAAPPAAPVVQKAPATTTTTTYAFFNAEESAFIEAAVERLIPGDETGPGARDAGVASYIDEQLAGAWGAGERLYRSGPWSPGKPTQGYQLPLTPAELFRTALHAIGDDLKKTHANFPALEPQQQDEYLKSLENGGKDLAGVPSKTFFQSLLEMTIEGYFSDPVYGGNKGMVSWQMIGFPGAYANYYELVDKHGIELKRAPMSLAQDAGGTVHVHADIPSSMGMPAK